MLVQRRSLKSSRQDWKGVNLALLSDMALRLSRPELLHKVGSKSNANDTKLGCLAHDSALTLL